MTIFDEEALKERAKALYTIPVTIASEKFETLPEECQNVLDDYYILQEEIYVLNNPVYEISSDQKYQILQCIVPHNGIRMVLVSIEDDHAKLEVHFYNRNFLAEIQIASEDPSALRRLFPIRDGRQGQKGGAAVRCAEASFLHLSNGERQVQADDTTGQVRVISVEDTVEQPVLILTVSPIGDYSTYTLCINTLDTSFSFDPLFSEIGFKFRPGCFNIDCAPEWTPAKPPKDNPAIDYLAKDYHSFKHTLIAAMAQRVPGWEPTSEADLDQVLLELFCVAADELSDYQDRVMNEAYLGTARKRVSLARHCRLVDYHIHQGNQATTWLALEIDGDASIGLPKGFVVWAGNENKTGSSIVFMVNREHSFFIGPEFQGDFYNASLSNELRNVFSINGVSISDTAEIHVHEADKQWVIVDEDTKQVYSIEKIFNKFFVYLPHLNPSLNKLGLYTWSGSIPSLAAGSTTADLQPLADNGSPKNDDDSLNEVKNLIHSGKIQHLLIQQWLNPETGHVQGRDPRKRQVLRLLPDNQGAEILEDPITGKSFLRVHWKEEDALKADYCFTVDCQDGIRNNVSIFHGNLVPICHGRPVNAVFKDPIKPLSAENEFHYEYTERWGTVCRLPFSPLAYKETPTGGEIPPRSTIKVEVVKDGDSDPWDEVISLVHSDDSAERGDHFVVETDEEGQSLLRFGNGKNGKKLADGAEVHCIYQVGYGPDGNIGADTLCYFDSDSFPLIKSCWNPFDVTSGRAPEPVDEIIRRAPEAYRYRQLRSVTLQDYIDRVEELPEVDRVAARYAWTGSWRTVQIAINPVSTHKFSPELRHKVARHLEAVRLIGEDLEIRGPRFVPLDIEVTLCIQPDYWIEDIRFLLEREFSEGYTLDGRLAFFHPDRWTFGQRLHARDIMGRIERIEGVVRVVSVTMKRWNDVTPGCAKISEVRANEIIRVRNDPDHMEDGFMTFIIGGGRK